MTLLLRIVSVLALVISLMTALVAGGLFWEFNYGGCKDGCESGMAYILFLPSLITAIVSAGVAYGFHRWANSRGGASGDQF